ncbi:MAG: hypothetical protein K8R69_12175 [Deltaproteobacteria bacterium]|nr:hypothetical protein [Deltaproteobacteria bacterium]
MKLIRLSSNLMTTLFTLTALSVGLGACSGGAVPGKGVDDTVQTFDDGFTAVADGLESIFTEDSPALRAIKNVVTDKNASIDQGFNCESGGTGTVSGTNNGDATSGTFDLAMNFQGCNGMTGAVSFSGDYEQDGTTLTLNIDFSEGSSPVNNTLQSSNTGCSGFFRDLDLFVVSSPDSAEATGTVYGGFRTNCLEPGGGVIVDCVWDTLDLNNNQQLADNCICSGEGC